MKFKEALDLMKKGIPMKLPSWDGYWTWDSTKETIVIHSLDNKVLDIRETKVVEFTINNILDDEWIPAYPDNTPILGGSTTFGFDEVAKYIKRSGKGLEFTRKSWENKEFIYAIPGSKFQDILQYGYGEYIGEPTIVSSIAKRTADNKIVIGWIPTNEDLFANDWMFCRNKK